MINPPFNFREIRRGDGTEGFAWATQVVEGGALAVVIDENANMFSSARIIDARLPLFCPCH